MIKKSNKDKILELFFNKPTYGFSLRELERFSKIGLPSVTNYVKILIQEGFVKSKKFKKYFLFYANRENKNFKIYKIFHNKKILYDSGLIDFLNIELSYPLIILFGSTSKGDDIESSDIDLFIGSPEKNINLIKFEKIIGKKIQIFMHKNIKSVKNNHLMNNILNGIIIEGFLEVF